MRKLFAAAVLAMAGFVSVSQAATLTHDYELNGSLADSLGGPSLLSDGGSLGTQLYTFGADQGLNLSNALSNAGDYSIELSFEFDALGGFRKILDFKNLSSDNGLYNLSTAVNFFNVTTGATGTFATGQFSHLILTRDGTTNQVTAYVDGGQKISFTDTGSDGVFSAANNIVRFFEDDNVTGGREASNGQVDFIKIYDGALTADEAEAITAPNTTPLPKSAYAGAALLLAITFTRRAKRVVVQA